MAVIFASQAVLTAHTLEAAFCPGAPSLDGLLDRLAAFRSEITTIETENGEECDLAARHAAKYRAGYCVSTEAGNKSTGLDAPGAMAEADKLFNAWPAHPSPERRRRLAAALIEQLLQLEKRKDESYQIAARLAAALRESESVKAEAALSFRERPGARVLSMVGAPHKPWFDSGLGLLQGVDIDDALTVLK